MSLRGALLEAIPSEPAAFRERALAAAERHDLAETRDRLERTDPDTFAGPAVLDGFDDLDSQTQQLVWRLWVFDTAPLGLTVSAPAYEDTPLVYATRTFRELTGYSWDRLRGENPRLLQGPGTAAEPVAELREAISIWTPVTVELRNYRRDGTPFTNRVSLVPVPGPDGTVRNWVGVQEAVATDS